MRRSDRGQEAVEFIDLSRCKPAEKAKGNVDLRGLNPAKSGTAELRFQIALKFRELFIPPRRSFESDEGAELTLIGGCLHARSKIMQAPAARCSGKNRDPK